jgi:DNA-binding PucR family transcriptional regulator
VGARRPRGQAGPEAAPLDGGTVDQLQRAATAAYPGSLAVPRNGDLVLLIPARTAGRPQERIRDLIQAQSRPAEGLAAGIGGRCANPGDFPESFGEAALALDLARRQADRGIVFTAGDLGLSGLLAASGASRKTLEALVDGSLGPLLRSDRGGTQYVRTLRTWLTKDRHLERTADELHVHPNTVRYRLGRAQELLELDLRDVDDRFQVDRALRLLDAIDGAARTTE